MILGLSSRLLEQSSSDSKLMPRRQQKLGIAWVNLQQAAQSKDLNKIKQSLAELENLGVE